MPDPVTTMTASAIASLAFQEFVKSGAGELAKKFTAEAIAKMGQLRELIWNKLKGNPDAEEALEKVHAGSEEEIPDVVTYLKSAMNNDREFASQVQAIAQEINAGRKPDRVGIVLVHGIGEQRQFEHLEEVVRNIAADLQNDEYLSSIQVNVQVSKDGAYRAEHQTWRAEGIATAIIEVVDILNKTTKLEFREVWWADLDESNSLAAFLDFWSWGLSLWSKPKYDRLNIGTAAIDMRLPGLKCTENTEGLLPDRGQPLQYLHRFYLLLVSFVMLLTLPLLWILGRGSRSILGFDIRPDILVEYLGDVKLYQQDKRIGKQILTDIGKNPPRVSIRRRVISTYVEMALEGYDRWYVLSHSLGTVPAFNGLMETEQSLPNYLEEKLWEKWTKKRPNNLKSIKRLATDEKQNMLPQRPIWLEDDEIINRSELFSKLKGFVTYGSPLSKFAVLWPSIVPINKDVSVFREDFEWINIFDPTDPVSDFTRFFDSKGANNCLIPKEIAYKAEKVFLLSHGEYLTFNPKREKSLIRQISQWLLSGNHFQSLAKKDDWRWPIPKENNKDSRIVSFYFGLGILIWFLLGFIISLVLSSIVPLVLSQTLNSLTKENPGILSAFLLRLNEWTSNPCFYILTTLIIIFIVGIIVRLKRKNINRVSPVEGKLSSQSITFGDT
jgi:hypothetical protein